MSKYDFEIADAELAELMLDRHETEARRCLDAGLVLPGLRGDARRARTRSTCSTRAAPSRRPTASGIIQRVRDLACACAQAYVSGEEGQRFPLSEPEPAAV